MTTTDSVRRSGERWGRARVAGNTLGVTAVVAIILAVSIGPASGERIYHSGLRNPNYQSAKWTVRIVSVALGGPVLGPSFMFGFEKGLYSMPRPTKSGP